MVEIPHEDMMGSDIQEFTATYQTGIRSLKLFAFTTTQQGLLQAVLFKGMATQLHGYTFPLTFLFNLHINCSSVQRAVSLCLYGDFP